MEAGGGCLHIATDIGDFLFVGGIYVDMVTEVSNFPEEDTDCRAKGMWLLAQPCSLDGCDAGRRSGYCLRFGVHA